MCAVCRNMMFQIFNTFSVAAESKVNPNYLPTPYCKYYSSLSNLPPLPLYISTLVNVKTEGVDKAISLQAFASVNEDNDHRTLTPSLL